MQEVISGRGLGDISPRSLRWLCPANPKNDTIDDKQPEELLIQRPETGTPDLESDQARAG